MCRASRYGLLTESIPGAFPLPQPEPKEIHRAPRGCNESLITPPPRRIARGFAFLRPFHLDFETISFKENRMTILILALCCPTGYAISRPIVRLLGV